MSFSQNRLFSFGDIINLGTIDTNKYSKIAHLLMMLIVLPFSVFIGLMYLLQILGWSCVFPVAAMTTLVIYNLHNMGKLKKLQSA